MKSRSRMRLVVAGATVVAALTATVYALAGHEPGTVPSYTGCLNTSSGTFVNLAQGDAPAAPCKDKEIQVHLGGGDITAVAAGPGLSGGGSEGAVSLSVDGSTIVTGVTPGFGLTGGGSGGDVTLAVDPTTIQRRVGSDCDFPGGSISKIAEDGSVSCSSHGVVATLSAGTVESEGSQDTDLCVIGSSGGKSENSLTSTPVTLPAGTYLPVPTGPPDDGFRWLINKISAVGSDPDDIYRGRAWAFIRSAGSDSSVSQFIRAFSSAGHENNLDQDFGTFTSAGGQYYLEIFAGADPCTYVLVRGGIDLVRIG